MIIRVSLKNRHSLNGTLISSRRLFHNFDAEEKNVRFKPSIQVLGGQDFVPGVRDIEPGIAIYPSESVTLSLSTPPFPPNYVHLE